MTRHQAQGFRTAKNDLDALLLEILSSIAAILVSTGYGFSRVNELTKLAFVRAADTADLKSGPRLSIARIAALTGLTRTDVSQIIRADDIKGPKIERPANRVARVATGWTTDSMFSQMGVGPRRLRFAGSGNTFTKLVRRYSGDIPPRAMLTEMSRLGMTRRDKFGYLVLVRSEVAHSRRTTKALKAAIPMINFLARATTTHSNSELTSRSDKIELKFSSLPQVFAAIRELNGRHSAFVAALEELGSRVDGQDRYAINVSVAVAATNPRASATTRHSKQKNRGAKARK